MIRQKEARKWINKKSVLVIDEEETSDDEFVPVGCVVTIKSAKGNFVGGIYENGEAAIFALEEIERIEKYDPKKWRDFYDVFGPL